LPQTRVFFTCSIPENAIRVEVLVWDSAWRRLPLAVRAVLVGLLILTAGNLPWAIFINANLQFSRSFPWAVPATVAYLWVFWYYLRGGGWPTRTSEIRRRNLRISPLPVRVWQWSLLAGASTFASLIALLMLFLRVVNIPQQQFGAFSQYPLSFVLPIILMGATVAGIVEEAAFRGYMQVPIERRYGVAIATAVVGIMFALAHLSHGISYALPLVPFYLAGSVVYSVLAYRTGSILPGVILHATIDVLLSLVAFERAISIKPIMRWIGVGYGPWATSLIAVVFAALGIWCFRKLSRITLPDISFAAVAE
jgi:membrane protease YdiL (CAAX protease family)